MRLFKCMGFYFLLVFASTFAFVPAYSYKERLPDVLYERAVQDVDGVFETITIHDFPTNVSGINLPELTAEGVFVVDVDSAVTIYEKNSKLPLYPASSTKIMTAIVAMDYYNNEDVLVADDKEFYPSIMGLKPFEEITFINVLHGLLISSGNDAAYVLASNYPGGYPAFVQKMNEKVSEIGLKDSSFLNPSGLNQDGHITTAWDLGQMTRYALMNETFASIVAKKTATVYGLNGERHLLRSTNKLIGEVVGLRGVKTGFTEEAGEVLVSYVERNDRRIVIVLLKSDDRFGETSKLVDWVFDNHEWKRFDYSSM